ncbi:MAG: aminotransferase class IV [Pseudomonadota bacterium]
MIWLNGEIVEDNSLAFAANDRGALLGDGLFETIKIDQGRPLFLTEHLCRMQVSARDLNLPIDRAYLRKGMEALLKHERAEKLGSARITVSRGPGPRGLSPIPMDQQRPTMMITVAPKSVEPPKEKSVAPDRLLLAPFIRSSGSPLVRMKTLSYGDNIAAKAWADAQGAADVIFLNENGAVTSTAMSNLFVEAEGGFLTPPLSAGILPGIVRELILHQAKAAGVKVQVKQLVQSDLWGRRLFRTNSLLGVRPAWFDHRQGAEQIEGGDNPLQDLYLAAELEESQS